MVIKMANETSNMELVFDVISDSIEVLFDHVKGDYFTLYSLTVKNMLAGEVLQDDLEEDAHKKLEEIYSRLSDKDISTEDIRKAIQSLMLRGLQETKNLPYNVCLKITRARPLGSCSSTCCWLWPL